MQPNQALGLAREVLLQVRPAAGILLDRLVYDLESHSATATFRVGVSTQFPNPDLREATWGQLTDATGQIGYALTGLLLHDGVDIFGTDFATYMSLIHQHRVNFVDAKFKFRHPCRVEQEFEIAARLEPFRGGATSLSKRYGEVDIAFIKMSFRATQRHDTQEPRELFTCRVMACCRFK